MSDVVFPQGNHLVKNDIYSFSKKTTQSKSEPKFHISIISLFLLKQMLWKSWHQNSKILNLKTQLLQSYRPLKKNNSNYSSVNACQWGSTKYRGKSIFVQPPHVCDNYLEMESSKLFKALLLMDILLLYFEVESSCSSQAL